MRNATLVLIAIACCLVASQAALAREYELTNPPIVYENGVQVQGATMLPSPGQVSSVKLGGSEQFQVDSFFDVFTELTLEPGETYHIDSFFDVFTELTLPGLPSASAQLSGPVRVGVKPMVGETGTFETEMIFMSLSGSAGPSLVEVREAPSLVSPGGTTVTDLGGGQFHIDSFFDVFTELSVDGGATWSPGNPPARMETPPMSGPGGQRHDNFTGNLVPGEIGQPPIMQNGDGSGWDGDGIPGGDWITYPDPEDGGPPWVNQWFYNDPFDPERWKEVYWDITVEPVDPSQPGDIVEVAINWSNEQFPDGTGQPPMPDQENAIEREIIFSGPVNGVIPIINRPEDGIPFIIPDYNPEWVSIDIRFADAVSEAGVIISGEIWHECVPEPTTMALLALGGLAVLRRRTR